MNATSLLVTMRPFTLAAMPFTSIGPLLLGALGAKAGGEKLPPDSSVEESPPAAPSLDGCAGCAAWTMATDVKNAVSRMVRGFMEKLGGTFGCCSGGVGIFNGKRLFARRENGLLSSVRAQSVARMRQAGRNYKPGLRQEPRESGMRVLGPPSQDLRGRV